jgi:hypothetical protein
VSSIYHDARPGTTLLSDWDASYFHGLICIVHEQMTQAVACLSNILLVPIAGADELAILHGIACPLLSRTVGPTEGVSLSPYPPDDSFPDVLVGV